VKKLLTTAAAALAVLGVAACAAPTTSIEPAPTVTVTEPAPVGNTDSERDRFADVVSDVLGVKIPEDDPILDAAIESTTGICVILADGRDDGIPANVALNILWEATDGDERAFEIVARGLAIYCPTEFDWLASAVEVPGVSI